MVYENDPWFETILIELEVVSDQASFPPTFEKSTLKAHYLSCLFMNKKSKQDDIYTADMAILMTWRPSWQFL
ncbi:hypothetical protein HanIR_Chr13g0666801 [Helianthus annuus]|nr:hypothetical protein HanIR_Chr13g0666801 [Helianthus annuus]